jgi:signal transduction histidine kinase/ActR/RegA family two-component response regulator
MKVQTRILLLLLAIVGVFAVGLTLIEARQHAKAREISRLRAEERSRSFDEFLQRLGEPLATLAKDDTNLDAMVQAIDRDDQTWIKAHINDAMWEASDAHAVWIYRPDRTLFFSANRLYADGPLQEIPLPGAAFDALYREHLMHFFLRVPEGMMEIRAATVHPSSDGWRTQTPPQGYFFAGRLWSNPYIRNLTRDSDNTSIKLLPVNGPAGPLPALADDNDSVSFWRLLPGWDGQPIARLLVINESPIVKELNRSSQQLLLWLVFCAAGLLLVLGFSVVSWVSRPLRLISQTLESEQVAPVEKLRGNKSEFGGLARLIQEFFAQRASLIAEVNERKSTQEALRESEEQLRQSQKMEAVGRLAGGVAHDFNNLLTAILGYAELLASNRDLTPTSRQSVEMIQKAGRQAAAVTHQLLAFSRKQMLQPRVIDLNALVIDFEKILQRVIGEHIDLKTRPEAEGARVKADPNQIEQVILNLGVNARDAMPKGGSLLIRTANVELDAATVRAHALDLTPGTYVLLEVSDTGKGMTDEVMSRIFEPFFTTKEPGKGTGLGLATVYGVVKQSGGSVTVESDPGAGSTFRIYLPLETGELDQSRPKTVAPLEMPRQSAETVLVVEDEEVVRELVCQVLADQGYDVLCAVNGREGLRMSEEHKGQIHLLMTDVVMPVIGGLELARRLSASRPDIKVLYVSGYSESDISEQGILEAELEFLEKPFTPNVLIRKVREVLHPSAPPKDGGQKPPASSDASKVF